MVKRFSKMGWIVLATLLSLVLVVLPACSTAVAYDLTIGTTAGGSTTPAPGVHTYTTVQVVNLKATPNEGYEFAGWTGETSTVADVSAATTTINVNGDYFITANFQQTVVPVSVLIGPQGFPEDPSLKPEYGGTLIHLHTGEAPTNIGAPWAAGAMGRDRPLARFALEKLLGMGPDGELVPQLATAWETDANAKTITFTLRQGVKFHDGTDFNAEAAKWNLEKYKAGPNLELKKMTAVEVLDPYKIRLTFSEWDSSLIRSFESVTTGMMVSPTWCQAHTEAEAKLHPVGTGPFKFKEYITGTSLEYVRFDDYWQEGLPYLDGVLIKFVSDPVVRLTAFLNGEGDVIHEFTPAVAADLEAQGYAVTGRVVHLKGICADTGAGSALADINVRRAIAHAIPTATLIDDVFDGQYQATNQLALPGWTAYDTSIEGYPYDPTQARALMTAAGYSATNRLHTKLVYSTHDLDDYLTVLKDLLADVWIDIDLQFDTAFRQDMAKPWSNYLMEFQFSYNDFEMLFDDALKGALAPGCPNYPSIVKPAAYGALYNQMLVTSDPATRKQLFKDLNKMAIDEYCLVIPQYGWLVFDSRQPYVHDYGYGVVASEFLPEQAWLSS
jgi:peptide/nickel transport system substrate-binding protein